MDYEAYVRERWEVYSWKSAPPNSEYFVDLLNSGNDKHGALTFPAKTPEAAWQAAYAFTLEREEEISRLKQDIAYMQERFADPFEDGWSEEEQPSANYQPERYEDGIEDWLFNNHTPPSDCDVREFVRDSYRAASIIQRLQQALAELEHGFKEQEGSK